MILITLNKKDNEVDIKITYSQTIGGKPRVEITAEADLSHHLIEGLFNILDKLARMEGVAHESREWRERPND